MQTTTDVDSVARRRTVTVRSAQIFGAFVVSFFQPKERRTKTISVRITPDLERNLEMLARLWTVGSQAFSGDGTLEVSQNDAAFRCLEASALAAIAEMLGPDTKRPETESEWKLVESAIRKRFAPK